MKRSGLSAGSFCSVLFVETERTAAAPVVMFQEGHIHPAGGDIQLPAQILHQFFREFLSGVIVTVHIQFDRDLQAFFETAVKVKAAFIFKADHGMGGQLIRQDRNHFGNVTADFLFGFTADLFAAVDSDIWHDTIPFFPDHVILYSL